MGAAFTLGMFLLTTLSVAQASCLPSPDPLPSPASPAGLCLCGAALGWGGQRAMLSLCHAPQRLPISRLGLLFPAGVR